MSRRHPVKYRDGIDAPDQLWVCPYCGAELNADCVGDECPACGTKLDDEDEGA